MAIIDDIVKLKDEGLSNKEVGEQLGMTHQKVAALIKKSSEPDAPKAVPKATPTKEETMPELTKFAESEVVVEGIQILTPEEYVAQNIAAGRAPYGGEIGATQQVSIEELRAYINSGWTPSMLMGRWQMDEEQLKQLVWKMSVAEMRDKPVSINFRMDFFK